MKAWRAGPSSGAQVTRAGRWAMGNILLRSFETPGGLPGRRDGTPRRKLESPAKLGWRQSDVSPPMINRDAWCPIEEPTSIGRLHFSRLKPGPMLRRISAAGERTGRPGPRPAEGVSSLKKGPSASTARPKGRRRPHPVATILFGRQIGGCLGPSWGRWKRRKKIKRQGLACSAGLQDQGDVSRDLHAAH